MTLAIGQIAHIDPANILSSARLTEDLAMGWFGRLRLAVCLEQAFDLELPNEVVARFVTVSDAVGYFRDFPSPVRAAAA